MNIQKHKSMLGAKYTGQGFERTVAEVVNAINEAEGVFHRGDLNVSTLIAANSNGDFQKALNCADLINFDGQGARLGALLLGIRPPERVTGVDLMLRLLHEAELHRFTVFFLGATDDVLAEMESKIKEEFPGLQLSGMRNGYFWGDECDVVKDINKVHPDMIFVGIKSPEKELFIQQYKGALATKFIMGVGGAFDVLSGKVRRAPVWMQKCGLEWTFRIYQEPKRMWRRYLVSNTLFAKLLLIELAKSLSKKVRG